LHPLLHALIIQPVMFADVAKFENKVNNLKDAFEEFSIRTQNKGLDLGTLRAYYKGLVAYYKGLTAYYTTLTRRIRRQGATHGPGFPDAR
jgi:hypothetical protein